MAYHFFEPENPKMNNSPRRRKPNMFIIYRKEMMKFKPSNIKMTEYSKLVSEWWKNHSIDEKWKLQRQYQIDRDQESQHTSNEIAEEGTDSNIINSIYFAYYLL
ncbi:15889_t:CDS:1 [Funneliformis geosporum]|uniref:6902_t:CDS:1 n=1 Tax=Funneliformis geosporum TaxID=1117311 RepID=A0A9W4WYG8_9GLOM|nr:6902_t:CDS:1 [Funneliformis geosporum]CAI2184339.1 15889_t:CDS:1 [Funneliformis geosporum]